MWRRFSNGLDNSNDKWPIILLNYQKHYQFGGIIKLNYADNYNWYLHEDNFSVHKS